MPYKKWYARVEKKVEHVAERRSEHGPGVEREAELERRLDRFQDQAVHHFQGGRYDARP
jgi:hypothetical protein